MAGGHVAGGPILAIAFPVVSEVSSDELGLRSSRSKDDLVCLGSAGFSRPEL